MKDLQVKILIGISGSGKSTKANKMINDSTVVVSRDSFRYMLTNKRLCSNKLEDAINDLMDYTIQVALSKKLNVVIDNTNLKAEYINHFIELVNDRAEVVFEIIATNLEQAKEWNKSRDRIVPENVIDRQYEQLQHLINTFDFTPRKIRKNAEFENYKQLNFVYENRVQIQNNDAVIFDIDGTLAVRKDRSPYDLNKVNLDYRNMFVSEALHAYRNAGYKIIILSGREDSCKELTEQWLADNYIDYDELHMRKSGDMRKDFIVKKEIYETHVKDKYYIFCVFDDRLSVIKMWESLGLFVFNCNQGNTIF